jgi:hypothetical protein
MSNHEFIRLLHNREASISVAASTARGMGKGTVMKARDFLRGLNPRLFVTDSEDIFLQKLDESTKALAKKLPRKRWGSARKFLNIFLRGLLYNHYLRKHYHLDKIEQFLEVPLDSLVATRLRKQERGLELPRWRGVIHLSRDISAKYQAFARQFAEMKGWHRVHLDLLYGPFQKSRSTPNIR